MLETGKPSTIYKGELSCDSEPPPRTRIFISASGEPSVVVTLTPASLPVRASDALVKDGFVQRTVYAFGIRQPIV